MERWHILNRNGEPGEEEELPPRPEDASPADGQSFRPWYKTDEHLHIENGQINGIHAHGNLEAIQSKLRAYIEEESKIIEKFGGSDDVLLPGVDIFLREE